LNRLRSCATAITAVVLYGVGGSLSALGAEATTPPGAEEAPGLLSDAFAWFVKGGPVMIPIALTSLVGLAFIIERAVALRRTTVIPADLQKTLSERIDALDVSGALEACEASDSSLARVVKAALLRRSGTLQEMEKAGEDAGIHELWMLRRNVRPISVVASLSETMSTGDTMGNPGAFAGAIREALFTTFFGLSVAIPMVPCFHWLYGKAQALVAEINETTGDLLLRLRDRTLQDQGAGQ